MTNKKTKTIAKVNVDNAIMRRQEALDKALENIHNINEIHISMANSKMGEIPSFGLLPMVTCTNCGHCSEFCYAAKGFYNMPKKIDNLAENTAMLLEKPEEVEKQLDSFLNKTTIIYKYFRWNDSGDLNLNYLRMVIRLAKKTPITKFLVFTKNYILIDKFLENGGVIPKNLKIILSKWGNDEIINNYNQPVAIVKVDDETELPTKAFKCTGECSSCLECWNARKGTVRYFDLH